MPVFYDHPLPPLQRVNLVGQGGQLNLQLQNGKVYTISGYNVISITLPEKTCTAHMFITFPSEGDELGFIFPEDMELYGNSPSDVQADDKWEVNVDSVGGALLYRKQAIV